MARARRAKRRPARIVVPVILALLIGGTAVGLGQGWLRGGTATTADVPSVMATEQTASPSSSSSVSVSASASSQQQPSVKPASAPTASNKTSAQAREALQRCRTAVRARDTVLAAARTGVGHWSEHVEAQTAKNAGDISAKKMSAIFSRTRQAGPGDVGRYQQAVKQEDQQSASCAAPPGATAAVKATMARCDERSRAQRPALRAAKDAMEDWKSHLAAMQRSRSGHVHDAQQVWLRAWRAAPPHINEFRSTTSALQDAPGC